MLLHVRVRALKVEETVCFLKHSKQHSIRLLRTYCTLLKLHHTQVLAQLRIFHAPISHQTIPKIVNFNETSVLVAFTVATGFQIEENLRFLANVVYSV